MCGWGLREQTLGQELIHIYIFYRHVQPSCYAFNCDGVVHVEFKGRKYSEGLDYPQMSNPLDSGNTKYKWLNSKTFFAWNSELVILFVCLTIWRSNQHFLIIFYLSRPGNEYQIRWVLCHRWDPKQKNTGLWVRCNL